jgi:hypothetical protein
MAHSCRRTTPSRRYFAQAILRMLHLCRRRHPVLLVKVQYETAVVPPLADIFVERVLVFLRLFFALHQELFVLAGQVLDAGLFRLEFANRDVGRDKAEQPHCQCQCGSRATGWGTVRVPSGKWRTMRRGQIANEGGEGLARVGNVTGQKIASKLAKPRGLCVCACVYYVRAQRNERLGARGPSWAVVGRLWSFQVPGNNPLFSP